MSRIPEQPGKPELPVRGPDPVQPRIGHLFRVHLGVLASSLSDHYGYPFEAIEAIQWLILPAMVIDPYYADGLHLDSEPSPIRATTEVGVFYSDVDPVMLLNAEEIAWSRQVRRVGPQAVPVA